MQAKKRYLLVTACGIFVLLCFYIGTSENGGNKTVFSESSGFSFIESDIFHENEDRHLSPRHRRDSWSSSLKGKHCRLENCFDFSKCRTGFKVYVYPTNGEKVSSNYKKMLSSIQESRFYTSNPEEACIFVLSVDTLDRDVLSKDCVKNIKQKIYSLPYWNNGKNHIIFNLYSGTWPEYVEHLDFDIGYAMLAKASISNSRYRPNFDVSIPLFHKSHPHKGGEPGQLTSNTIPPGKKYTLVFKGKRYLTGIGSETRNALYHIHNGKDIILLTTCKHGKGWQHSMDERCPIDNSEYDKYDYLNMLHNSTFCLVPRGRRLGSFRFLEALQAACIPVLLSDGWVLPFSDVIDWNRAAIWGDERLLLQISDIVRSIPNSDILSLRQQTQLLWEKYLSSVDRIVQTTLQIVENRIYNHPLHSSFIWNHVPGALAVHSGYSDMLEEFPFFAQVTSSVPKDKFTAVIYVQNSVLISSSPLYKLVKNVAQSEYVDRILVIWQCDAVIPAETSWPVGNKVPIVVRQSQVKTISARFVLDEEILTDAVLSLDEDVLLTTDEIDFAFSVWKAFPQRIVGYPARTHFWEDTSAKWGYSSKWTNDYSMVLTGAAFYHKYYNYAYSNLLNNKSRQVVESLNNCEDILMNFLVSHITRLPPIKVTQRKLYKDSMMPGSMSRSEWLGAEHFSERHTCLNTFVGIFGYMPLIRSNMRLDPGLFKDPVSILRKKYRVLEKVV